MNPYNLFESFNQLNVLIIGDVMLDQYLTGKVERISPEAPVPVVSLQESDNRLGGAANVALNIKAMGAKPFLCSVIGNDDNGRIFTDLLPKAGIDTSGITYSHQRCTTVKTRVIAANQHLLRVDREDLYDLTKQESIQLLSSVQKILNEQEVHVILLQDYNKGVLSLEIIRKVLLEGVTREIPTVVDPKRNNFLEYRHATLFKPNLKEIQEALPFEVIATQESLTKAASFLRAKMGNKNTMVTLSEAGIFIDYEAQQAILPTQARNIADVCGAGDTVISIAALGIAKGMNLTDIAVLANLAGGQVCEKVGVVSVHKAQLLKEYEHLLAHSET